MASIELGDMEEIARKNSNGNLSNYLRTIIREDHIKRLEIVTEEKTDMKINLFQSFCFFFLAITLFVSIYGYYTTTVYSLITLIMLSLSVFSIVFIAFYMYLNLMQHRKTKKVG